MSNRPLRRSRQPGRAALLATSIVLGAATWALSATAAPATQLVPHLAVYDLTLAKTRGNSQMASVRGRILYDFEGSRCKGYSLNFRQVSELNTGEGKTALTDLRSTTWEDAAGKSYRFASQNYLNERLVDSVEGKAARNADTVDVRLSKPQPKSFTIPVAVAFPTEHMRRIIEAARAGKTLIELPVYDGSETGEKLYNTLAVIGRPIAAGTKVEDAAAGQAGLADLTRWPVTISYFDKSKATGKAGGEQTPVYTISFELYENGISRALSLDYNDFVISGQLSTLSIKSAQACD